MPSHKVLCSGLAFALALLGIVFITSGCSCESSSSAAAADACSTGGGSGDDAGKSQVVCVFDLQMDFPTTGLVIATAAVSCSAPVATASTTLTILFTPSGASTAGQRSEGSKTVTSIPPFSITQDADCFAGSYEAVASITGVGVNGAPFHASENQNLVPLTSADCLAG